METVRNFLVNYMNDLLDEIENMILEGQSLHGEIHSLQCIMNKIVRSMDLKLQIELGWGRGVEVFHAQIPRHHKDELGHVGHQIQLMVRLMSDQTISRQDTQDVTRILRHINEDIEPLQKALGGPATQLALTDSDIAYCLKQIGSVIDALED